MIHVEGDGNWNAGSDSLDPFVRVHVEEKRGLDGMELLYAIAHGLKFARMHGIVV